MRSIALVAALCLGAFYAAAQNTDEGTTVREAVVPVEHIGTCMCKLDPGQNGNQPETVSSRPEQILRQIIRFRLDLKVLFKLAKNGYSFPNDSPNLLNSPNVTDVFGLQLGANRVQGEMLQMRFRQLEDAFSAFFNADDEEPVQISAPDEDGVLVEHAHHPGADADEAPEQEDR